MRFGIVNVQDAVRLAITKSAGIAKMADVVRIALTISATVESASTVIVGRFHATFVDVVAGGGLAYQVANGASLTQWKAEKA